MDTATKFEWKRTELSPTSPVVTDRFGTRAVLVGHLVFLIGVAGSGSQSIGHVLDIQLRSWKPIPPQSGSLKWYLFLHTANLFGDQIFITGAKHYARWNTVEKVDGLFSLDLMSLELTKTETFGEKPKHVGETTADVYEEKQQLVSYGGTIGLINSACEILRVLDLDRMAWKIPKTKGTAPGPLYRHGSCITNHTLFIMGGKTRGGYSGSLHLIRLDLSEYTWQLVNTRGYIDQHRLTAAVVGVGNGRLIVFGGYAQSRTDHLLVLEDVFAEQPICWKVKSKRNAKAIYTYYGLGPKPRESSSLLVSGTRLIILPNEADETGTCYFELSAAV